MSVKPTADAPITEKDSHYIWHHMMPYREQQPAMVIEKAEGVWVTDVHGNRYLDGMSGLWCVNVGYGRKELAETAYDQLQTMPYYPLTQSHVPAVTLAEKLNDWLEGDYRIFFSNSGAEANETAFKIARQYHHQNGEAGRYKFISRYRAYHGHTLGALAATGQAQRKYRYEPLAPGFLHVHAPDPYRIPEGQTEQSWNETCVKMIEDTINWERPETVAGVIMEPIITGGGVLLPHPEYLKKVKQICRQYGVLLIVDEVICGFGRTGKKFGHQHYGIKPDIVTMAKGITSGYLPLSATAVRQELFDVFKEGDENTHFRHVNTFGGNPAACAVAIKNLEIYEREGLVERAEQLGEKMRRSLQPLESNSLVGDIRHKGLLFGIELVKDKETKEPAIEAVTKAVAACKAKGAIVGRNGDTVSGYNNVLTMAPPLCIAEEDALWLAGVVKDVLNDLAERE